MEYGPKRRIEWITLLSCDLIGEVVTHLTVKDVARLCSCNHEWWDRTAHAMAQCRRLHWVLPSMVEYTSNSNSPYHFFQNLGFRRNVKPHSCLVEDAFLLESMMCKTRGLSLSRYMTNIPTWVRYIGSPAVHKWPVNWTNREGPSHLNVKNATVSVEYLSDGIERVAVVVRLTIEHRWHNDAQGVPSTPLRTVRVAVTIPVGCCTEQVDPFSRRRKWTFGMQHTIGRIGDVNRCFHEVRGARVTFYEESIHGLRTIITSSSYKRLATNVFIGAVGNACGGECAEGFYRSCDISDGWRQRTACRHYMIVRVKNYAHCPVPHLPPFLLPPDMVRTLS